MESILLALPIDQLFRIANLLAMIAWIGLVVDRPGRRFHKIVSFISERFIPLLFCVAYVALLALQMNSGHQANFRSIDGVSEIFSSKNGVMIGWLHYLAFDLLVGAYIARKMREMNLRRIIIIPILIATFMFGPLGFLAYSFVNILNRNDSSK